jgi:putative IMPACT (imprinted ancient) family translation regulator
LKDNVEFRYSDDGEPSGTAGLPIYEVIKSADLTNILLVVTRYFGGVKLGTGGLARAYRDSAREVLDLAVKVKRLIKQQFQIIYEHDQTAVVMKAISDYGLSPLATDYNEHVRMTCAIRLGKYQEFSRDIVERSHGRVRVEKV